MKTTLRLNLLCLLTVLLLAACGYHNPYIYSGPEKAIYVAHWQNKTNALQLDTKIYQSLTHWFQKSGSIKITKEKAGADLILAGEITSIDLPSVSWDSISNSTGNKVRLFVRYVLKDLKTGEIIWEEPKKLYTTDYADRTVTTTGEDEALKVIIEDMSEDIYLGVLNKIRRMDRKAAAGN